MSAVPPRICWKVTKFSGKSLYTFRLGIKDACLSNDEGIKELSDDGVNRAAVLAESSSAIIAVIDPILFMVDLSYVITLELYTACPISVGYVKCQPSNDE